MILFYGLNDFFKFTALLVVFMNKFKSSKKESSILDCFTYDLKSFFYDQYKEVDSEETPATVMIVYQKELEWKEFDYFDTVQFRIFFDKDALTGSNPINVKLLSQTEKPNMNVAREIVSKIYDIYGKDDASKGAWTNKDQKDYKEKNFKRTWSIKQGDSFIHLEYSEEKGFSLNILFFNNMIEVVQ